MGGINKERNRKEKNEQKNGNKERQEEVKNEKDLVKESSFLSGDR